MSLNAANQCCMMINLQYSYCNELIPIPMFVLLLYIPHHVSTNSSMDVNYSSVVVVWHQPFTQAIQSNFVPNFVPNSTTRYGISDNKGGEVQCVQESHMTWILAHTSPEIIKLLEIVFFQHLEVGKTDSFVVSLHFTCSSTVIFWHRRD